MELPYLHLRDSTTCDTLHIYSTYIYLYTVYTYDLFPLSVSLALSVTCCREYLFMSIHTNTHSLTLSLSRSLCLSLCCYYLAVSLLRTLFCVAFSIWAIYIYITEIELRGAIPLAELMSIDDPHSGVAYFKSNRAAACPAFLIIVVNRADPAKSSMNVST